MTSRGQGASLISNLVLCGKTDYSLTFYNSACKKNKSLIAASVRQEMDHKMELLSRKFRGMPLLCILNTEAVRLFFNFASHCCRGCAHYGLLITIRHARIPCIFLCGIRGSEGSSEWGSRLSQ
jgi:hypothetical protein